MSASHSRITELKNRNAELESENERLSRLINTQGPAQVREVEIAAEERWFKQEQANTDLQTRLQQCEEALRSLSDAMRATERSKWQYSANITDALIAASAALTPAPASASEEVLNYE